MLIAPIALVLIVPQEPVLLQSAYILCVFVRSGRLSHQQVAYILTRARSCMHF
jgi:hypothetical protein